MLATGVFMQACICNYIYVRIVPLTLPKNEKNFFPKVDGCNNHLKKTNKGISSYKLSASQDPKLHAKVTHILEEKMSCCSDFLPHEKLVLWTELDLWYDQTKMKKKTVISM
jgi:hypothetical protein